MKTLVFMLIIYADTGNGPRTVAAEPYSFDRACLREAIAINTKRDKFLAMCMPIIKELNDE